MIYNILITSGKIRDVKMRDKFDAHLWVHNGKIKKNHIPDKYLKQLMKIQK